MTPIARMTDDPSHEWPPSRPYFVKRSLDRLFCRWRPQTSCDMILVSGCDWGRQQLASSNANVSIDAMSPIRRTMFTEFVADSIGRGQAEARLLTKMFQRGSLFLAKIPEYFYREVTGSRPDLQVIAGVGSEFGPRVRTDHQIWPTILAIRVSEKQSQTKNSG